jgi:hypothetical protein
MTGKGTIGAPTCFCWGEKSGEKHCCCWMNLKRKIQAYAVDSSVMRTLFNNLFAIPNIPKYFYASHPPTNIHITSKHNLVLKKTSSVKSQWCKGTSRYPFYQVRQGRTWSRNYKSPPPPPPSPPPTRFRILIF